MGRHPTAQLRHVARRSAEAGAPPRKGPGVSKWGLVGKAEQRRPRNRSSRQSRALNARLSAPLGEKGRAFATANWTNATTGPRRQKRSHPRAPTTAPFRTRKTDYSEKPGFLSSAEADPAPDHIHLLLSIPPKMSVSGFMGYLKGKSSLMIFQKFGNMKFAYRNREFWCKGYYVDTVGKNTKAIKEYIENQLKMDRESDQISLYDPRDPFTGSK